MEEDPKWPLPNMLQRQCPHRQTQLHILNNSHTVLKQERYNVRQKQGPIRLIFQHLQKNTPSSLSITADLGDSEYCIPQYMLTNLRPNIFVWNEQ